MFHVGGKGHHMRFTRRHRSLSFLGAIIIPIIIVGAANGCSKATANLQGSPATSASIDTADQIAGTPVATTANAAPPSTAAPTSSTPAPPSTAAPTSSALAPAVAASTPAAVSNQPMTTAQQQAVEAAQNYLALGQGFSYEGLLQQLTSSSGSGFANSDAEFAINYLNPNWDQQAVEAAQGYLKLGGFSRDSLIQQLTSSAGGGFTQAQAEYAVSKVGL
jgi:3-oxoacyl-ACP reductase-like protein